MYDVLGKEMSSNERWMGRKSEEDDPNLLYSLLFLSLWKICHFVDPWNAGSLTSYSLWIPCWKLSFLTRMTHSNYQQHALSLYAPKTSVLDLSSDVIWFLVVLKICSCFFFLQKKTELSDSLPPQLSTKVHSLFLPSFPCPCLDNGSLIYII